MPRGADDVGRVARPGSNPVVQWAALALIAGGVALGVTCYREAVHEGGRPAASASAGAPSCGDPDCRVCREIGEAGRVGRERDFISDAWRQGAID